MEGAAGLTEAFVFLFRAAVLVGVFVVARSLTEGSSGPPIRAYSWAIGVAVVSALLVYSSIGSHVEDADPLFGGGHRVMDYEPSNAERQQKAIFTGVCIGVAGVIGCSAGLKRRGA